MFRLHLSEYHCDSSHGLIHARPENFETTKRKIKDTCSAAETIKETNKIK